MLVRNLNPRFTSDFATFSRVKEVCHHSLIAECGPVVVDADHLLDDNVAKLHGMVVLVAVGLLHHDLILMPSDAARDCLRGQAIHLSDAGCGCERQSGRCSGADQRGFAAKFASEVFAGGCLQILEPHGMIRGPLDSPAHGRRHYGGSQKVYVPAALIIGCTPSFA